MTSLENKFAKFERERGFLYQTIEDISNDIADLAEMCILVHIPSSRIKASELLHDAFVVKQGRTFMTTPEPGPSDVLIEINARDYGMSPVTTYPAIIGLDTAGVVAKLSSNVTTVPGPGSHVIAFASSFY
ncbi:hypothetical protein N7463_001140 [Penicillium fimorum]|uniref:Uncharacterized protein n=1 Tax=Penicillium fimorum TaxID=1882269 RepID=A0A9W9Y7R7_9EURO|nr:hypothetical protein N7463_001140 [Penicillium fimorum]